MIQSQTSTLEGHQAVFAKLLSKKHPMRVSNQTGRSSACPSPSAEAVSPSQMGHVKVYILAITGFRGNVI